MEYIYADTDSVETKYTDLNFIKGVLQKPYQYWLSGTGDSAIQVKPEERLIFFKLRQGIFIMQHPDYLAPLIKPAARSAKAVTHHVGGEPMDVPDVCLCNEEVAFDIIKSYVESGGKMDAKYRWVDIYEYIDYKE
ncbi:MAG: hypothetical protein JNM19_02345 [Chitinophagaceae bacterium]|nr:hypothetical protein [Chitinophagaceae bacterium]